jgi:DnaJ homolog subfamily B member 6
MLLKVYDMHGVWPPSEAFDAPPPGRNRRHTGQDPFFDFDSNFHGFHGMRGFGAGGSSVPPRNPFTDPFVLFNSMFGDLNRHMPDPFMHFDTFDPREHRRPRHDPFAREAMFGPGGPGPMPGPFSSSAGMSMFGGLGASGGAPQRFRAQSSFGATGGRYGWQRESRVTTTVNGVTQSTWTRVDSDVSLHTHPRVLI